MSEDVSRLVRKVRSNDAIAIGDDVIIQFKRVNPEDDFVRMTIMCPKGMTVYHAPRNESVPEPD